MIWSTGRIKAVQFRLIPLNGRDRAWAAQCIEGNCKFYWCICAQSTKNDMAIGVAVSDPPTGPFKDALGKPLIIWQTTT